MKSKALQGYPYPGAPAVPPPPPQIAFHLQSFQPHRQLLITQQNGRSGPLGAFSKSTLSSASASSLLEATGRTMAELTT